ncbi:MAG TPA: hypothetical protein VFQ44_17930 [Streptosporangiaceae bacterium]|nr:hypothetical protein [Streptosporangiaceae bacterium]
MTVKANLPALYQQLKKLPWTAVPSVPAVSTDHGRRAGHIAAANRHHARDAQPTLKLLQTA